MDAQIAQKVSRLAYALKASGAASDNKEAYEMATEILKKKEAANNSGVTNNNTNNNSGTTTDRNSRTNAEGNNSVFLGKDSLGFEQKGRTLKELAAEAVKEEFKKEQ